MFQPARYDENIWRASRLMRILAGVATFFRVVVLWDQVEQVRVRRVQTQLVSEIERDWEDRIEANRRADISDHPWRDER